jgi:LacI family transcriptional regulator
MGSHGRIRIKDIARLAQVSTGTVDRVLHGRGEVSESNREKINKIIHDLKYKPNILARSLAGKQDIRLASVLPDYVAGAYWEMPGSGMDKALTELSLFRLTLDRYFFDLSDPASFENAAAAALSTLPDGVIMAPMFPGPAAAFSDRLTEAGIPYVYIDSSLASGKPLAYYGQHSYRSGYALAHLLLGGLQAGAELFLFHGASPEEETNQSRQRSEGFAGYLRQEAVAGKYTIVDAYLPMLSEAESDRVLAQLWEAHPRVCGAAVLNSRVFQISGFLERSGRTGIRLAGYDLLPASVEALRRGTVSWLISQRPQEQGYLAVQALYSKLLLDRDVRMVQYMPLDLLNRVNIDFYVELLSG